MYGLIVTFNIKPYIRVWFRVLGGLKKFPWSKFSRCTSNMELSF